MIFKNNYPEDEEWTAYINNMNEWTPPELQLRYMIGYIQSGPHYPKHVHQELIDQFIEHQRESEWNRTMSILRGMGVKFDGKEAWRIRKEWMASEAAEAKRKQEAMGL